MRRKNFLKIFIPVLAVTMAAPVHVMADEAEDMKSVEVAAEAEMPEAAETPETEEISESVETPEAPENTETSAEQESGGITEAPDGTEESEETDKETDEGTVPEETVDTEVPGETEEEAVPEDAENTEVPEETEENEAPEKTDDIKSPVGTEDKDTNEDKENPDFEYTNEELIAAQHIVELPDIEEDFRFWTVEKKYAFAGDTLKIKEEMNDASRSVGMLDKYGVCFVLKEEDGWLYVESGRVRGFVRAGQVITEDEGQELLEKYRNEAGENANREKIKYVGIQDFAKKAEEFVPWQENEAFTYLRATSEQTVIEKKYALCNADKLNIREEKNTESRIVGTMLKGALCYVIADEDKEWIYIESGDVRGFVKSEYIDFDEKTREQVEENGEESYAPAVKLVEPDENKACYYTLTSIKPGDSKSGIRQSLLEFAAQFVGNPYVWGGTSLTNGADCSGFAQSVYEAYGYDLPRTSRDQSQFGIKIAPEDARPGDLIFYAENGVVNHVVIYAGDGKTIEAMNESRGITQSSVDYGSAVWATSVLDDTD